MPGFRDRKLFGQKEQTVRAGGGPGEGRSMEGIDVPCSTLLVSSTPPIDIWFF